MRLIIPMIIQTILLDSTGAVWTDEASNVRRPDLSRADQVDAEHQSRHRKEGSNPSSGSTNQQLNAAIARSSRVAGAANPHGWPYDFRWVSKKVTMRRRASWADGSW
jgi:hypothetical protein